MEGGKEANYWPGFVDALSNVVLTLVFVLVIFVFALLMASNKVKAKMTEVQQAETETKANQVQLNQALKELEQMRNQESTDPKAQQATSCLRFNKSDANQAAEVDPDGNSLLILFSVNAISVTDDTTKVIHDFIEAYRAKAGTKDIKLSINSSDDPTAMSPLMAKETQLGRMLNVRNSLLADDVSPAGIAIHNVAPVTQKDSYNWVRINVEK